MAPLPNPRESERLARASELVRRARGDLARAAVATSELSKRERFIDGGAGAGRPRTAGGSEVLYADADAATVFSAVTEDASRVPEGWASRRSPRRRSPRRRSPERSSRAIQPRLTTRRVPGGTDYDALYCAACEFDERARCEFCHFSKVSGVRRLTMPRLTSELLRLKPDTSATRLAREIRTSFRRRPTEPSRGDAAAATADAPRTEHRVVRPKRAAAAPRLRRRCSTRTKHLSRRRRDHDADAGLSTRCDAADATEIVRRRYATSDAAAIALHEKLDGWWASGGRELSRDLCDAHAGGRAVLPGLARGAGWYPRRATRLH